LEAVSELFFSAFGLLNDEAKDLQMTFVVVESFFSPFHPSLSELFGILFREGGPEGRLAANLIFAEAEKVKDNSNNLHSRHLIDEATLKNPQNLENFLCFEKLIVYCSIVVDLSLNVLDEGSERLLALSVFFF
jgi:hypothetical protein